MDNKLMWSPSIDDIKKSNMFNFMKLIEVKYSKTFKSYNDLYLWSIDNLQEFWSEVWDFTDIKYSKKYNKVLDNTEKMLGSKWFSGAKINFAENLLRYKDDHIALIFRGEDHIRYKLTYSELFNEVAEVSEAMKLIGIKPGDRVVGFMPNMPHAVIAMLAASSLGALWSSCSPDFGIKGVLDRFGQIKPKILFTSDGYFFKGKKIDSLKKISDIVDSIPSIERVVVVPYLEKKPNLKFMKNTVLYEDFKIHNNDFFEFNQFEFSHPLYIMYSSGTTGLPKCMVQSSGGILINHLKELYLHTNLNRNDIIFYFTTCGWMMWNWLVSSLAIGATIVLYDGNPFFPSPDVLWKMVEEEKITVFGTSAGYLTALENFCVEPIKKFKLPTLKTVLSTGSPLSVESFEFVYTKIKKNVQLSSIAGGTDLNGCFALGNPMDSVYSGELQCRGLGMSVHAFDEYGEPVIEKEGELVCTKPFPSMPIYFWNDESNKKYHDAYFDVYENIWRHGDYVLITNHGGLVFLGRSDATLNPGGVRIGTAEIYRQVEQINEVDDSIVVGQKWNNDVRVILFVKMKNNIELDEIIKKNIRETIKLNASPRHVPSKIIKVKDIPYTLNMKKVELAVKNVIHGKKVLNKDALMNPESLNFYKYIKELEKK